MNPWIWVLAIIGTGIGLYLLAAWGLDQWAAREEQRQDAERRKFSQIMKAGTPRAAGIGSRRIS